MITRSNVEALGFLAQHATVFVCLFMALMLGMRSMFSARAFLMIVMYMQCVRRQWVHRYCQQPMQHPGHSPGSGSPWACSLHVPWRQQRELCVQSDA